jgi:hypothetical protein
VYDHPYDSFSVRRVLSHALSGCRMIGVHHRKSDCLRGKRLQITMPVVTTPV